MLKFRTQDAEEGTQDAEEGTQDAEEGTQDAEGQKPLNGSQERQMMSSHKEPHIVSQEPQMMNLL